MSFSKRKAKNIFIENNNGFAIPQILILGIELQLALVD